MPQVSLPAITDDDGTGQFGTPVNKAWSDAVAVELDKHVYSATNPTLYPKDVIDEMKNARGSKNTVDERLDVSLNEDGTLKTQSGLVTAAQAKSIIGMKNLFGNDTFLIWPGGLSAAPAHWILDTGTIARETTEKKIGLASVKLTRAGGVDCKLRQVLLSAGAFQAFFKNEYVHFFCAVKTSIASHARIQIDDGNTTTESSYHTGGGTWENLVVTHQVSGAATKLEGNILVANSNGDAYFDLASFVWADQNMPPASWRPAEKIYGCLFVPLNGTPPVQDGLFHYVFARPAIIKDIQGYAVTAPGGADKLTIDIEKYETGPAWVSVFTGAKDLITGANNAGSVQPDGDFDHRCFDGKSGTDVVNALVRLNVDVAGGAVADVRIMIRALQYVKPLEDLMSYNDL